MLSTRSPYRTPRRHVLSALTEQKPKAVSSNLSRTTSSEPGGRKTLTSKVHVCTHVCALHAIRPGAGAIPNALQSPARKLKLVEQLFHRKCIRGRATIDIVPRPLKVQEFSTGWDAQEFLLGDWTHDGTKQLEAKREQSGRGEVPDGRDHMLELMWSGPKKRLEGLTETHGVVQYLWHGDVLKKDTSFSQLGAKSCGKPHNTTPTRVVDSGQASNMRNLDIGARGEEEGDMSRSPGAKANQCTKASCVDRRDHVKTWISIAPTGRLLRNAQNPQELLKALHDTLLGYWHVVNQGMVHRDIRDGNMLIAEPRSYFEQYSRQEGVIQEEPQTTSVQYPLKNSIQLMHGTLLPPRQEPCGFLSDYDLCAKQTGAKYAFYGRFLNQEDGKADSSTTYEPIHFRAGTSVFTSVRILEISLSEPYEHHFLDDLQSFFWYIYWCVIRHVDYRPNGPIHRNDAADTLLEHLEPSNFKQRTLARLKVACLIDCSFGQISKDLGACENLWANNPAIVQLIRELGTFFYDIMRIPITQPTPRYKPETEFSKIVQIILKSLEEARYSTEPSLISCCPQC